MGIVVCMHMYTHIGTHKHIHTKPKKYNISKIFF